MAARRHPEWITVRAPVGEAVERMSALLRRYRLPTVCREAMCPNLAECWSRRTATFLLLGAVCTRGCRFCAVRQGRPQPPDPDEPERVAAAAVELGLRHAVLTSVNRDDLPDQGSGQFARTAQAIHRSDPSIGIEALIPDFRGRRKEVDRVLAAPIGVLNHNVETVPRLYRRVRPGADYGRSLAVIGWAARSGRAVAKAGLMLGLGERDPEIEAVLRDLREAGCRLLTLGQYLQPTADRLPVERYLPPEEFDAWRTRALAMGFVHVESGPLVRSSYHAGAQAAGLGPAMPAIP